MAVTAKKYPHGVKRFLAGDIDWDAATIKAALVASTYTPADSHEFFDTSVNAHEVTGTGYTDGGVTLGSKTNTVTLSSAGTSWAASTAYSAGDIVRASVDNGHLFMCVVAGTSGGSEPTWDTNNRQETADNTVVWVEIGTAIVALDAANAQWLSSTITARYLVIYKSGTAGSGDFLCGYVDFGQNESSSNGTFEVQFDSLGIFVFTIDDV